MSAVYVVVPEGIDDPARSSGGNTYDRRICDGLRALGWSVHVHAVRGGWPKPDARAYADLDGVIGSIPDDALVVVDGLIASTAPDVLVPATVRLRLVVLVHMPLVTDPPPGDNQDHDVVVARECAVLTAATAVVTTSNWTRRRLIERYPVRPDRVHIAEPGVDRAALAPGSSCGGELICVAAVAPHKGHDVLLAALARLKDQPWRCICVGPLDRDPAFVEHLRHEAEATGLGDRVLFAGPRTGGALNAAYAAADLLVLASRAETYGMVVTEALARGLPVVATDVGGLPEALGSDNDGDRPGLLVPPENPIQLATALRAWLTDADLRSSLQRAARDRRKTLSGWSATTARIADVLAEATP